LTEFNPKTTDEIKAAFDIFRPGESPPAADLDMVKAILMCFSVSILKDFTKEKLTIEYPKQAKKSAVHCIAVEIMKGVEANQLIDGDKDTPKTNSEVTCTYQEMSFA
jgi:hypothetical protein